MLRKVLIANRGEIAVRIARACQEMGALAVAVYSDADRDAMHVAVADEAVRIGPPPPRESYLRPEALIEAARRTGCDAVHPGYGFLSENAAFAEAVRDAGLTWVGPPPEAIRRMGVKPDARETMRAAGVPVVPGYAGTLESDALRRAARDLGYPVLVKAASGGGGKGMRLVRSEGELAEAVEGAAREAAGAFGDGTVYLEKCLEDARHVEIQVLADRAGRIVHLGERDCSVQRRHQKLVEESPSPACDAAMRERMGAAAVAAARAVGYENAGTVEFLVDLDRNFYFLEMNTRLQVEHPVTECVTGVDLVQAQMRVAAGEPLWLRQEDLAPRGHAVECRVYAEDPARDHLPATGVVRCAEEPRGPGVRVDAGVQTGSVVGLDYDPLLAKVIAWAEDRDRALQRMDWALSRYVLLGVTTNLPFLRDVLAHEVFRRGEATTRFLERCFPAWAPSGEAPDEAYVAAALWALLEGGAPGADRATDGDRHNPWRIPDGFRLGGR